MGNRDFRHREQKKVKKDPKKIPRLDIVTAPVNVEVIRKGKKKTEEEES